MKSNKSLFLLCLFFCVSFSATNINAQVNVELSEEIVELNGSEFYVHIVKAGQTIYSIAKAYNVDVAEIYKYNPDSKNLIDIGQKLKIPKKNTQTQTEKGVEPPPIQDSGFVYHKVKPGETLFRITQIYGLKEDVLKEYNEGLTSDIYPGQWIKVPEHEKVVADKTRESFGTDIIEYVVKPKDNFYQLKKTYNVSKDQLEKLNPELKKYGLQLGMKIIIPKMDKLEYVAPEIDFLAEVEIDTFFANIPSIDAFNTPCDSLSKSKDVYKIALIMPFYTEFLKDIDVSNEYRIKEESFYPSFEYIHFYEGFLLAADSMAKMGLKLDLYVYDSKNDTSVIRGITNKPEFGELDLIFGPFSNEGLKIIVNETKGTQTKVVCPVNVDSQILKNNNHLFATIPSSFDEINGIIEYVNDSLSNADFVILHNNKRNELYALKYIKMIYWKYAAENNLDTNNFHIVNYQNEAWKQLDNIFKVNKPAVLLNLVDNEAYISNFVRTLYKKTNTYDLYLAGTERRWSKYSTLEEKYLVSLNLLLVSNSFIEYENYFVKDFVKKFRSEYKTEPKQIAFQGYDLAWYFLNAIGRYGTHFEKCLNGLKINSMHTIYQYRNNEPDAWHNIYVNVYQYIDYRLIDKKRPVQKMDIEKGSEIGVDINNTDNRAN